MNIQFLLNDTTLENGNKYRLFDISCDSKRATIVAVSGKQNYVNVVVNNASHRAFKGLGNIFSTFEKAVEKYSDPKIKAIINAAKIECEA